MQLDPFSPIGTGAPGTGPRPDGDVLGMILRHASNRHQTMQAAEDDRISITFAELGSAVARIAGGLRACGIGQDARVGLAIPNSVDFLTASLACMWLGAVFVPLDVNEPWQRADTIIEDCAPSLVLTTDDDYRHATMTLARLELPSASGEINEPLIDIPTAPAYIIYTSGTTGKPKGVVISRSAFASSVISAMDALNLDENTRGLCVSAFHFDGSYGGLFPPLCAGGSVVIPPRDSLVFPRVFIRLVKKHQITTTTFSPSYLRLLLSSGLLEQLANSDLRVMSLGGEASSVADIRRLHAAIPGLRVFNQYGPTEATIAVTHHELHPADLTFARLTPIGRPHPAVTFHLLDRQGHLITRPGSASGELCIGGSQVMSGYWRSPELTEKVLRDDIVPGDRVFLTGDLVGRDDSGTYTFLDRTGGFIKRNSLRISLVELATALNCISGVLNATCTSFAGDDGSTKIAAFAVTSVTMTAFELRARAVEVTPQGMLPDVFHVVDHIPLTPSGKVDATMLLNHIGVTIPIPDIIEVSR